MGVISYDVELNNLLSNITTISANFVQEKTNDSPKQSGNFIISKPNKFKWVIKSPNEQILVSNGKKFWNYDVILEQVTVQNSTNALAHAPITLLSGSSELLNNYDIIKISNNKFKLIAKNIEKNNDKSSFKEASLNFVNKVPTEIAITDFSNKQFNLKFSKITVNSQINNKIFDFKAPEGVDVLTN